MNTKLTTEKTTKGKESNFIVERVEGDDRAFRFTHKLPNGRIRTLINSLTVAAFFISLIPFFSNEQLQANAAIYVFGFYLFVLATLFVWREVVFSRKARFAESTKNIHACVHSIRDAHKSIDKKDKEQALANLTKSLDALSVAFSIITGTHCRACIKIIVVKRSNHSGENDNVVVSTETLVRNSSSYSNKNQSAKSSPISDNTDFNVIFTDDEKYYLCNDLTKELGYINSNWPNHPDKRRDFINKRTYDYASTLVLPIRSGGMEGEKDIGFLCIDSLTRNIFERRYDVDHAAIVADTLYYLLLRYRNEKSFHLKSEPVVPTAPTVTEATPKTVKPQPRPVRKGVK